LRILQIKIENEIQKNCQLFGAAPATMPRPQKKSRKNENEN